jgi:hypothetical protein
MDRAKVEALARRIVLALDGALIVALECRVDADMVQVAEDREALARIYRRLITRPPIPGAPEAVYIAKTRWLAALLEAEFGAWKGPGMLPGPVGSLNRRRGY